MERYLNLRDESKKHLQIADHILTMTYPLVNDPKLLLSVLENINLSLNEAVNSAVLYERELKLIPPYHDTPEGRLEVFRRIAEKHGINSESLKLIEEIRTIISEHRESPVEFSKKDEYVICAEEFSSIKTINAKEMKEFLSKAKIFIADVSNIVDKKTEAK